MTKVVYIFDEVTKEVLGAYEAQESPLEPGVFLAPICSTDTPPPSAVDGQTRHFEDGAWVYRPVPVPDVPEAPGPVERTPLEKIQAIEAANPFTHRTLRELSIAVGQIAALVTGGDIADNPAMRKLLEIQALVAPLETEIEELAVDVRGKP